MQENNTFIQGKILNYSFLPIQLKKDRLEKADLVFQAWLKLKNEQIKQKRHLEREKSQRKQQQEKSDKEQKKLDAEKVKPTSLNLT